MERIRLTRTTDIQYAILDGVPLFLDVVRPAHEDICPIILAVFGGGWCSGDRQTLGAASHRLARAGFIVVTIDYRLAPEYPYPIACQDIKTAVQWIIDHANEFAGDASRLGAYGVSSGGHLVALLASEVNTPLSCTVCWGGPMDLRRDPVTYPYRSYPLAFMGTCIHDDPALYEQVSPLCRLSPNTPPILLLHGGNDQVVPIDQCRHMAERAKEIGAAVTILELPGAPHEPGNPRDAVMSLGWEAIIAFFHEHLSTKCHDSAFTLVGEAKLSSYI